MNTEPNSAAPNVGQQRLVRDLTPEQIENWRNVLVGMIGPYAAIMPEADILAIRDKMQSQMPESEANVKGDSQSPEKRS